MKQFYSQRPTEKHSLQEVIRLLEREKMNCKVDIRFCKNLRAPGFMKKSFFSDPTVTIKRMGQH
jgi:hypothetical protein